MKSKMPSTQKYTARALRYAGTVLLALALFPLADFPLSLCFVFFCAVSWFLFGEVAGNISEFPLAIPWRLC